MDVRLGTHAGRAMALLLALATSELAAQDRPRGMLHGTVRDTLGNPVAHVEIVVPGTDIAARSSDAGSYVLVGVPPGRVSLWVRRLGFEPLSAEVVLPSGTDLRVDIELTPSPAMLEEVGVSATRSLNAQKLDGFHERRRTANGFFLTEAEIRVRTSQSPTELLRTMHRVKIVPLRSGFGNLIRIGSGRAQCAPVIYLDGLRVTESEVDAVPVERIIAIEVYPRAVDVPLPYRGSFDCGAVGFWMRTGPQPREAPPSPDDSASGRPDAERSVEGPHSPRRGTMPA